LQVGVSGSDYVIPASLAEAAEMLTGGPRTILAGGTDFYPALVEKPLTRPVLDLSDISDLRGITAAADHYRVGAMTSWTDLVSADLPLSCRGLQSAASQVGSVQVQNLGTIGGNLCNASPAADGVPPLLSLDASVELVSVRGSRTMRLDQFLIGYRATALAEDELLVAVLLPRPPEGSVSSFLKLGSRSYLAISIVMVAALLAFENGRVSAARIAVGACSPVARRLPDLETALVGRSVDDDLVAMVAADHLADLSPIDDARGSGSYRSDAALTLVRRAVADCVRQS
jgi:CO/xanthine dehydrogenase FAD-binding subunit